MKKGSALIFGGLKEMDFLLATALRGSAAAGARKSGDVTERVQIPKKTGWGSRWKENLIAKMRPNISEYLLGQSKGGLNLAD
jgi:hypothetical protein